MDGQHCMACDGTLNVPQRQCHDQDGNVIASYDYQTVPCPGLTCVACTAKDTELAALKEFTASLAEGRFAVRDGYTMLDFLKLWWEQEKLEGKRKDAELARLRADLETERMRLAACGTAALGYYKRGELMAPEYRSGSLDDVLRLYESNTALRAERDDMMRLYRIEHEKHTATLALVEALRRVAP